MCVELTLCSLYNSKPYKLIIYNCNIYSCIVIPSIKVDNLTRKLKKNNDWITIEGPLLSYYCDILYMSHTLNISLPPFKPTKGLSSSSHNNKWALPRQTFFVYPWWKKPFHHLPKFKSGCKFYLCTHFSLAPLFPSSLAHLFSSCLSGRHKLVCFTTSLNQALFLTQWLIISYHHPLGLSCLLLCLSQPLPYNCLPSEVHLVISLSFTKHKCTGWSHHRIPHTVICLDCTRTSLHIHLYCPHSQCCILLPHQCVTSTWYWGYQKHYLTKSSCIHST